MDRPVIVGLMASSLILAGCSKDAEQQAVPVPVRTAVVSTTAEDAGFAYAGQIASRVESAVGFRVAGRMTQRLADVGDRLRAGAPLAQLDTMPFELALREAGAGVTAARTGLQLAEADVARNAGLVAERIVSPAQFDRLQGARDAAKARLIEAESRRALLRDELGYATLRVPIAGIVTAVEAEVGQYLPAGQPVFRIAQAGGIEAVVDVPETRVAGLSVGQTASIELLSDGQRLTGRIREIAPSADPATRTFRVRVELSANGPARIGMTARVRFVQLGARQSIRLPLTALFQDRNRSAVWVVRRDNRSLELRPITVGQIGLETFTVSSGVRSGERVVTAGVHRLDVKTPVRLWDGRLP